MWSGVHGVTQPLSGTQTRPRPTALTASTPSAQDVGNPSIRYVISIRYLLQTPKYTLFLSPRKIKNHRSREPVES